MRELVFFHIWKMSLALFYTRARENIDEYFLRVRLLWRVVLLK